jgi:hypothetical protein
MPLDMTPEDYLKLTEDKVKKRKDAFEAFKLEQEVRESLKWKWIGKLGSSLGVVTIVVGIIASLVGVMLNTCSLKEEQNKNREAFTNQTDQIKLQIDQLKLQTQKQDEETKQAEQKDFNDLLRGATDAKTSPAQRVPLIWALQKYWKPDYELVLANALASMIANDSDRSVMESCAEVIGHAYEEDTPEPVQDRLKELLYGNRRGVIGVVMRTENLIWDRLKTGITNPDASDTTNASDWVHDPHYELRIFYICEAVRKNWENLREANFNKASLPRILLYQAQVQDANLEEADLSGGRLFGTHFERASMSKVHLEGANLAGAFFNGAHLEKAFLGPPKATDIAKEPDHLDHTDLENANFSDAYLTGADLRKANLKGAILNNADLTDANLEGAVVAKQALEKGRGKYTGNPIEPPQ